MPSTNFQLDHSSHRGAAPLPLRFLAHDVDLALNVGALFRIADALGVEHVHLSGSSPVPPDPKIRKSSRSAERHVAWSHAADPLDTVSRAEGPGLAPRQPGAEHAKHLAGYAGRGARRPHLPGRRRREHRRVPGLARRIGRDGAHPDARPQLVDERRQRLRDRELGDRAPARTLTFRPAARSGGRRRPWPARRPSRRGHWPGLARPRRASRRASCAVARARRRGDRVRRGPSGRRASRSR